MLAVTKDRNHEQELVLQKAKKKERSFGSPLDPLLSILSHFTTSSDLSDRIYKIFTMLDPEAIGTIDYEDLMCGLRKLNFNPPIHVSYDDFFSMTSKKQVLNHSGRLEPDGFEAMIREQLRHYGQRHTAKAMQGAAASGSSIGHVLFVLKLMSATLDDLSERVDKMDQRPPMLQPAPALIRRASQSVHPVEFGHHLLDDVEEERSVSAMSSQGREEVPVTASSVSQSGLHSAKAKYLQDRGKLDRERSIRGIEFKVRIVSVTHLPKEDLIGTCDPYCKLKCQGAAFQTRVIKNTYNAHYDEDFAFSVPYSSAASGAPVLEIAVFDWDLGSEDDYIGEVTMPLGPREFSRSKHVLKLTNSRTETPVIGHDGEQTELLIQLIDMTGSSPSVPFDMHSENGDGENQTSASLLRDVSDSSQADARSGAAGRGSPSSLSARRGLKIPPIASNAADAGGSGASFNGERSTPHRVGAEERSQADISSRALGVPCYSDSALLHSKVDALKSSVTHTENKVNKLLEFVAQQQDMQRQILASQQNTEAQMALLLQYLPLAQQRQRAAMVTAAAAAGFPVNVEPSANLHSSTTSFDRSRSFSTLEASLSKKQTDHSNIRRSDSGMRRSGARGMAEASITPPLIHLPVSTPREGEGAGGLDGRHHFTDATPPPMHRHRSKGQSSLISQLTRSLEIDSLGAESDSARDSETIARLARARGGHGIGAAAAANADEDSARRKNDDMPVKMPSESASLIMMSSGQSGVAANSPSSDVPVSRKRNEVKASRPASRGEGLIYGGSGSDLALVQDPLMRAESAEPARKGGEGGWEKSANVQQGLSSLEMAM